MGIFQAALSKSKVVQRFYNLTKVKQILSTTRISYVVFDDFNRDNNTLSVGNSSTGQAWSNGLNSKAIWGIQNNQLYCVYNSSSSIPILVIDDALVSKRISVDVLMTSTPPRVVFRVKDASNFIVVILNVNYIELQKVVDNTWTIIETVNITLTAGTLYNITIEDIGSKIKVYHNNVLIISVTDITHNTYTKAGVRMGSIGLFTPRFDNYKVEAL